MKATLGAFVTVFYPCFVGGVCRCTNVLRTSTTALARVSTTY